MVRGKLEGEGRRAGDSRRKGRDPGSFKGLPARNSEKEGGDMPSKKRSPARERKIRESLAEL